MTTLRNRRVGKFELQRETFLAPDEGMRRIAAQCVFLDVDVDLFRDACYVTAISDRWFREIDEGEIIPAYRWFQDADGYVEAREIQ